MDWLIVGQSTMEDSRLYSRKDSRALGAWRMSFTADEQELLHSIMGGSSFLQSGETQEAEVEDYGCGLTILQRSLQG